MALPLPRSSCRADDNVGERGGWGDNDAGGEVASLSSLREGEEGGGTSLVIVVIVKPHWRQHWEEKGAGEQRRQLREQEGRGTLSVCCHRCHRAALVTCDIGESGGWGSIDTNYVRGG